MQPQRCDNNVSDNQPKHTGREAEPIGKRRKPKRHDCEQQRQINDENDQPAPECTGDGSSLDKFIDPKTHNGNRRPVRKDLRDLRRGDDREDRAVAFPAQTPRDKPHGPKGEDRAAALKQYQPNIIFRSVGDVPARALTLGNGIFSLNGDRSIRWIRIHVTSVFFRSGRCQTVKIFLQSCLNLYCLTQHVKKHL